MQHHEFEGLLAQLEQTHVNNEDGEAAYVHQDEEEHHRHMEDFLNSFSDGLDEHNFTPSLSEYDTDSVMTGTEYTESLVPSSYAGMDSHGGTLDYFFFYRSLKILGASAFIFGPDCSIVTKEDSRCRHTYVYLVHKVLLLNTTL